MESLVVEFLYGTPEKFKKEIVWNWQYWGKPHFNGERIEFCSALEWAAILTPEYETDDGKTTAYIQRYRVRFLPPNGERHDKDEIEDAADNFILNVLKEYKRDHYDELMWFKE